MNNETARHLGPIGVPGKKPSAFIGFVYIPFDVDRDRFVKHCLETCTVCLITDSGQVYKDVMVSKLNLMEMEFPESSETVGSSVVCVNIPVHNTPVVTSVLKLDDQNSILDNEHIFRFLKVYGNNVVDLQGDAKKGTLNITVNSSDTNAESNISFHNKDNKAKVKVFVQGDLTVDCEEVLRIENTKEVVIEDENKNLVRLDKKGLTYTKDGKGQKVVMGEDLVDWLGDFCTALQQMTMLSSAPGSPTSPPVNTAEFAKLQVKLKTLLSKYTKVA